MIYRPFRAHFSPFGTHLCPPFKMEEAESGGFIHLMRQKNVQFFSPSFLRDVGDSMKNHLRKVRDGYKAGKGGEMLIFVNSDPIGSPTCSKSIPQSTRSGFSQSPSIS